MPRRVDKANPVVWIFEESLASRHRLEDAFLALGAEVVGNPASFGDEADQRFRFVRIELVEDEDPSRIGIHIYRASYMRDEVLLCSSRPDRRLNRFSCGHIEVGDEG